MATRVWESHVLSAPVDTVWGVIRPLTFAYNPAVASTEVEDKKLASEVGAVVRVTYKDRTVQRLKILEISDAAYSVSWELVESIPPVEVLAVNHTVKLRRVTDAGHTFIEWTADFSKDASQAVLQDQRFKQRDHFNALGAAVERKEEKRSVIGGIAGTYSPEKAREAVVGVWTELQALSKAADAASLDQPTVVALADRYKKLPISWQINWRAADLSAECAQRVADSTREKLNAARTRVGDNGLPLPRLFNADSEPPAAAAGPPAKAAG